jgi:hypothetical protein
MIGAAAVLVEFPRPTAPAVYVGRQECAGLMPDFDLWNLTEDIPGYPAGSSVSTDTLLKLGYQLPAKPEERA